MTPKILKSTNTKYNFLIRFVHFISKLLTFVSVISKQNQFHSIFKLKLANRDFTEINNIEGFKDLFKQNNKINKSSAIWCSKTETKGIEKKLSTLYTRTIIS